MSPLIEFECHPDAMSVSMSPLRGAQQVQNSGEPATTLGPTGPLHFIDAEASLNTLMDFLQVTPCPSVTPTPVGSPAASPKRTPNFNAVRLPPLDTSLSLHQPRLANSRSALQSPLQTTNEAHAAFLPPEFFLEQSAQHSESHRKPQRPNTEEQHRSKSPFVKTEVLTLSNFSWNPTNPQNYVDCICTEPAVEAMNLLEEEIQKMMQVISI